ncbi:MAG: tRNA (5-methylaminomethyl-2-thiouridine)(34)-methyltransferase MnmD [Paracoccaceae bacterium]
MTADQTATVEWRDGGTPVSVRFDDPYFSVQDGYAETRHVFLSGNDLPARFRPGFRIAELGFGTGLNLLATAATLRAKAASGTISYTSFEAYPLSPTDIRLALTDFPIPQHLVDTFLAAWDRGERAFSLPGVSITIIEGDVRQSLPRWQGKADAWFLDGFSPAKNPEMWETALMAEVAGHTAPGGTFATYSAAGHIRRSLARAGFEVQRVPGFGRKRHMTIGRLKEPA